VSLGNFGARYCQESSKHVLVVWKYMTEMLHDGVVISNLNVACPQAKNNENKVCID
jgi:hypothetical protein